MSITFDAVTFRYPGTGTGVFDIHLRVESGEFLAVIGPSGSGKTTLLNLLAGFLRPERGRILVNDEDVTALGPERRNIGIVFQSYSLFPHMTVVDNVAYPLKIRGMARQERMRRAREALERVGLATQHERLPATLSGGQQQRVALARALVFEPRALLLDEPLSALDAALRAGMRDEILRVQQAARIATLHVTHDQEEALSMGSRVAVMFDGRLVQTDPPQTLYDEPETAQVAAFVGSTNLFDARIAGPGRLDSAIGPLVAATGSRRAGERVVAMIRPERVLPNPPDAGDGQPNRFRGTLRHDRFLGAVRRYDLAVDGGTIQGETTIRGRIDSVSIPPEAIRLLESDQPTDRRTTP